MAHNDIPRWQQMSKEELLTELAEIYPDFTSSESEQIECIYVNHSYKLMCRYMGGWEITNRDVFIMLWPKDRKVAIAPRRRKTDIDIVKVETLLDVVGRLLYD